MSDQVIPRRKSEVIKEEIQSWANEIKSLKEQREEIDGRIEDAANKVQLLWREYERDYR